MPRLQAAIRASADVRALEGKISGDPKLMSKLRANGDAPGDVVVAATDDAGVAYLFVDK